MGSDGCAYIPLLREMIIRFVIIIIVDVVVVDVVVIDCYNDLVKCKLPFQFNIFNFGILLFSIILY